MGRPNKPLISRKRAARAALSVIDVQGLSSLSLELVARRLGVKAPSLYYHFKNKSELLAEVARLLLVDIEAPKFDRTNWDETLIDLCKATRRMILQHPNAAPLLLRYFPRNILLSAYDLWISVCPYPPEDKLAILEGTEKLTFASALFEASARANAIEPMPQFDPAEFPALAEAMRANPHDEEQLFEETVRRFLMGFRVSRRDVDKNPLPMAKPQLKRKNTPQQAPSAQKRSPKKTAKAK